MADVHPPARRSAWSPLGRAKRAWRDGDLVRGYRLLDPIGAGGFSRVYAAEDLNAKRFVALKVSRLRTAESRSRFAAEAEIGERLASTKGVVGVIGQARTRDGRPVLVMPLYALGNTEDLLLAKGRSTPSEVAELVRQVAQGLDAMHRQQYVHRDVSPRNVLRSAEQGFAIGDLGCARPFDSTAQPPWTESLTPGYAAPEASVSTAVQTIASDVYGLAATVWALFTGAPPYGAPPDPGAIDLSARYELLRQTRRPPVDHLLAAGVRADVAELLAGSLDPDPTRRAARILDLSTSLSLLLVDRQRHSTVAPPARRDDHDGHGLGPIRPPHRAVAPPPLPTTRADGLPVSPTPDPPPGVRRRWPAVAAVLGCFLASFIVVRLASAPTDAERSSAGPSPTASPSPAAAQIAPQDLKVDATTENDVTLNWTPPHDKDAVVLLQRSVDGGPFREVEDDPGRARGRMVVSVADPELRYCFRILVVVRVQDSQRSNTACTAARSPAGP